MSSEQYEKLRTDRKNALYVAVTDVLDVLAKVREREDMALVIWNTEDIRAFAQTLLIEQLRKYTQ